MEINDAETHARLWTKKLIKAVAFAVKHHGSQVRKFNGEPYVMHPIRVAERLLQYDPECSTPMIYAALFHDLLEDSTTVKEDEIASEFGEETLRIVKELTNDKEKIASVGKTQYLCEKICSLSNSALTVKLCDRLDNLSDIQPEHAWSAEYAKQTWKMLDSREKHINWFSSAQSALYSGIKYKLQQAGYFESSF